MKHLLRETDCITLCLDVWTSKVTRGYLGVTAHFLDTDGKLRNVLLGCFRFKGSHTADAILELTVEIIAEYGIRNKVKFITTDNAAAMLKAFRDFLPSDFCDNEEPGVIPRKIKKIFTVFEIFVSY